MKLVALAVLTFSALASGQVVPTERGVRADVFRGLGDMTRVLNLTEQERGALLARYQQIELAATTPLPGPEALATYARVQAMTTRCSEQILPRMAGRGRDLPRLSNTLEQPERLARFLAFTAKLELRRPSEEAQALSPAQACEEAARLVRP